MVERKAITDRMKVLCLLSRWFTPCAICGGRINPWDEIDWDHTHALVHGGDHHYNNLRPLHRACHKSKTKADIQANAKVKRLCNPKPSRHPMKASGRKMPSRPFPKRAKP